MLASFGILPTDTTLILKKPQPIEIFNYLTSLSLSLEKERKGTLFKCLVDLALEH